MLGTFSNTKLAGGAAAQKVLKADGASRFQRGLALGDGLVFNESHACGGFLLLGMEDRCSAYGSSDGKELATGGVCRIILITLIILITPITLRRQV
jgi:hypothetical protein